MKLTANEALAVIRKKCMECCGGSRNMVNRCNSKSCPLYPYRSLKAMGMEWTKNLPLKGQISFSDILPKVKKTTENKGRQEG